MCSESAKLMVTEIVSYKDFPDIPMDWILTLKDHTVPQKKQRQNIKYLAKIENIYELDTCHNAMISRPEHIVKIIYGAYKGN